MATIKKEEEKKLGLNLRDVYQLLISECRYGYTRNNHLMPWGAYEKVKRIIPQMYELDKRYAINTLKQICEECVWDELGNFEPDKDDEHGNKELSVNFIKWCLNCIYEYEAALGIEEKWIPPYYSAYKGLYKDLFDDFLKRR